MAAQTKPKGRRGQAKTNYSPQSKSAWKTINETQKRVDKIIKDNSFLSADAKKCKVKGLKKFPPIPKACATLQQVNNWIDRAETVLQFNGDKLEAEITRLELQSVVKEMANDIKRIGGQFATRKRKS